MNDSGSTRRPGPASTLEQVRQALVAAATGRLYEVGADIGLSSVRLSEAIEIVGISRATAYRSLADGELSPQERLRRDVLVRVLARDTRGTNLEAVEHAVGEELEANAELLSSPDVADRTRAFRAVLRVGSQVSFHGVGVAKDRSILMATMSAVTSQEGPIPQWQVDALRAGERAAATQFGDLYTSFATMFGYRLRAGLTIAQFSTAAAALLEGLCLRYGFNDELDGLARSTGTGGAVEMWTLYGISFEGLLLAFFEPSNSDNPFADLANH